MHQNSACYAPEHTGPNLKTENMSQLIGSSLPHSYHDGGSSLHRCMQNVDMSALARRIDVSPTPSLAQCSHVGMMQGMNGGMIKSETGYAGSSQYMFGNDGNVLEVRPAIGDASVSSFSSVESNSQPVNESLLDADNSSLGYLGQIPRNFSLSDLTVDFSNSSGSFSPLYNCICVHCCACIFRAKMYVGLLIIPLFFFLPFHPDILGSYSGSPFLGADTNFLDHHGRGEHQGEGFSI